MNDLQKLLALRGVRGIDIARARQLNYHSVHKCIKGQRPAPHVMKAIAEHLGLEVAQIFGPRSVRALPKLIAREIDRCADSERERLRERFLLDSADSIPNKSRASND